VLTSDGRRARQAVFTSADAWIHPLELVAIGLIEAEEVEEHVTQ
jgi:hypothetical protein